MFVIIPCQVTKEQVTPQLSKNKNNPNNKSLNTIYDSKPEAGDKEEATSTDQRESDENNQQTTDRQ